MALNGTSATEAYLTTNENKTILAGVLKVVEVTAVDMGDTLYVQNFVLFIVLLDIATRPSIFVCFLA